MFGGPADDILIGNAGKNNASRRRGRDACVAEYTATCEVALGT
jgi:hypothetical protein